MSFAPKYRRVSLLLAACALLILVGGCTTGRAGDAAAQPPGVKAPVSTDGGAAEPEGQTGTGEPAPLSPEELARIHNRFGLLLLAELLKGRGSGENIVLSPTSIALALSMAYNGATGATAEGMAEALQIAGLDRGRVNEASLALLQLLAASPEADGADRGVHLDIANSIWHSDLFVLHDGFLLDNARFYRAHVAALDFAAPDTPAAINAWVREATRGLIPSVVDRLDPETVMLLINAVYFQGDWTTPFNPAATRPAPFRLADGGTAEVPMMYRDGNIGYFADERLQAVRLPYGADGRFALYVLLPHDGTDFAAFAQELTAEDLEHVAQGVQQRFGEVLVPRLDVTYKAKLKDVLSALGMGAAFQPGQATFGRMASGAGRNLYLGDVLHQTVLQVDEEGTEAAAATSIDVRLTSVPMYEFRFVADRPFVLAVRDDDTGALLFVGAIADPRA